MITYGITALPLHRYGNYYSKESRTHLSVIANTDAEARAKAISLLRKFDGFSDWKWTTRVESVVETPDEPEPVVLETVFDSPKPKRRKPFRVTKFTT